ncbi:hypothetical protein Tco_1265507 [Tanacetum coccineum]
MVDGEWVDNPNRVKEEFSYHFATRFQAPVARRSRLNFMFPNRLTSDQVVELEKSISRDEIRNAVWACGENKSPGPDGFTWLEGHVLSAAFNSTWSSIITEVNSLKIKGVDLISHCKIRVGKGTGTSFWKDLWIGDNLLKLSFPQFVCS